MVSTKHVASVTENTEPKTSQDHDLPGNAPIDDRTLNALGYKQEFKRDLTIWESFAVSFSILGVLPSVASTISFGLGYGGTGGAVWGWLVAATCIQFTALAMAELCSSMPTAGGLYYASAALAPEGWAPLCSWFVGYSNLIGFGVGPCSINYALAAMLVTAGQIAYPTYVPRPWHIYMTLLALCVVQGIVTMQSTKFIGWVNKIGTCINIVVVLVFVIWFPVGSINTPKTNNTHDVWTSFDNGTQWPIGWAVVMGFTTAIYSLCGYDSSLHLSEEVANADRAGPRAIVMTAQFGLYLGWACILVIAYTVKNIPDVVAGPYGQPFGSLCLQVLGPRSGIAMFSLVIIAQFFVGQGCLIAASRIVFAFARDGAIPGSRWLSHVNTHFKTPVNAVWAIVLLSVLIGLLLFASPIAIAAVFSVTALGQYTSFTFPIALKLFFGKHRFRPGPWNLGRWSTPVGAVAVAWWLVIAPALCFPAARGADLSPLNMNWTCLIYGGSMSLALAYYGVSGRRWFKGPRVNIDHVVHPGNREKDDYTIALEGK